MKAKTKYIRKQLLMITAKYNILFSKYKDLLIKKNNLVEKIKDLNEKEEDLLKKHEVFVKNHDDLVQQLRDKVECPVCLEVPKKAPIPVCPNGHVICATCVRGDCPKCRVRMGQGKSSLAVTVMENIQHRCENEGCEEKLSFGELAKHGRQCDFRLVNCPSQGIVGCCSDKVSLASLATHLKSSCASVNNNDGKINSNKMHKFSYAFHKTKRRPEGLTMWKLNIMLFDGNLFVLKVARYQVNESVRWLFVVQMVGGKEETDKYGVNLIVHMPGDEPGGKKHSRSLRYCGDICNIDVTTMLAAEEQGLDLTIVDGAMKRFLVDKNNNDSMSNFFVSVDLYERDT